MEEGEGGEQREEKVNFQVFGFGYWLVGVIFEMKNRYLLVN